MTSNSFLYEGIRMLADFHTVESLSFAKNFFVKDDDVILVTYPRSGTHWMVQILSLIVSEGDPTWVQTVKTHNRFPWIESQHWQKILVDQDGPRLMGTHLPIHLFPKSYFTTRAKIIYVMRNPRDVITSSYFMTQRVSFLKGLETFDKYFHAFINGDVFYGSWFDHILGWLTRRDTENFLLMSYEELQKDLRGSIQKLSQFLGKYLTPEQLDSAVQNSSFSAMNNNMMSNSALLKNPEDNTDFNLPMLRKGLCGDWKNHFTVAQSEAFDKVYQEKMSSLDPSLFPWSEHC